MLHFVMAPSFPFSLACLKEAALSYATPDNFERLDERGSRIAWAGSIELYAYLEEIGTFARYPDPDADSVKEAHFTVTLRLTTSYGCLDTAMRDVTIPLNYTPQEGLQFGEDGARLMRDMIESLTEPARFARAIDRELRTLSDHIKEVGELTEMI